MGVRVFCTQCGQCLDVPTDDFGGTATCPRCGSTRRVQDLIRRDMPLPAVITPGPPSVVATDSQHAATAVDVPGQAEPTRPVQEVFDPSSALAMATENTMPASTAFAAGARAHSGPMGSDDAHMPALADVPKEPGFSAAPPQTQFAPVPPVTSPQASVPGLDIVLGVAHTIASLIGRAAFWLDYKAYGWRGALVCTLATVTWFASFFSSHVYAVLLVLLATLLYLLVLARIWGLRDETGDWTWSHTSQRMRAWLRGSWQGLLDMTDLPGIEIVRVVGARLVTVGMLMLVATHGANAMLGALLQTFGSGGWIEESKTFATTLQVFGGVAAATGALLLYLWSRGRKRGLHVPLNALNNTPQLTFDAWRDDPVAVTSDPALQQLLEVLRAWKPRSCEYESDYEASLMRHLRRRVPGTKIEQQRPVRYKDRHVGRIDLVVGESIGLELKRALTGTEMDRAVGQVWKYLEAWEKGPVALLLCESRAGMDDLLATRLQELRAMGRPILVIAAGRRLS